ncbi:MAG: UDP-N-acetylmuramoylalanyl-D-glutamyl-2,6-diaminopimelate--D-alanyl-D-alanine ligase [Rhizobiaceae bacterium]|nr:UDP-N-acetylmuramoylalanyl-D-glutamyl-2,6-diaminopimelate--D-alanyl-D-alanine ligase [Rhizobiaceae bacterium]MCV0406560.1 UDP-N-acetylmuramoylalanyl-D-glutamyl-2,6-diaminopimelate--D-alanyl-D-alanine ligase [Rhizobiaceae bacterium]
MTRLWTGSGMIEAMGGRPFGSVPESISGVSIDSRTLQPGEAFFAIKGDQFDGHDFATAALKAGASVLVIAEGKLPALGRITAPMIVVDDVLAALGRLGAAARERSRARVIAVTGSAGKTTTKEMLRHMLAGQGAVHASVQSFNNHWGVPLTLARMPEDTDFGIFEIGMNHPGEIRPLVKLVRPHVAMVTMIAAAHLGHFSSMDEIARAKAEIFEGLDKDGHALINRDDPRARILAKLAKEAAAAHVTGFGEQGRIPYLLTSFRASDGGSDVTFRIAGREIAARIGAPGRHIAQNAIAALAAVHLSGGDVEAAAASLATFQAEKGRGKRYLLGHEGAQITLIDESYNANPASMRAAIEVLSTTPVAEGGRRIAVLGDMLELGEHARSLHAGLAKALPGSGIDLLLLGGPEMKALAEAAPKEIAAEHREDLNAIRKLVLETVRPGDAVMVKSSKSVGFSSIVEALLEAHDKRADERRSA